MPPPQCAPRGSVSGAARCTLGPGQARRVVWSGEILTSRPTEQTQSEWLVGEGRFELPTSSSRTKRANQAALLPEEGKTTKPLAEGEGFEPPEPCGSADFESAALDQTMRPLHAILRQMRR